MTMSIVGILSASLSCGIGDVSFLSMTAFFHRNCVSAWSSGTGAAGLIGALSYAALTSALSPETTLLLVTMVPVSLLLVYFFLLARPDHPKFHVQCRCFRRNYDTLMEVEPGIHERLSVLSFDGQLRTIRSDNPEEYEVYMRDSQSRTGLNNENASDDWPIVPADNVDLQQQHPSLKVKLRILKDLAGLLIFLSLVYFFEYIINQSLFELLIFTNTISEAEQYRWYQVLYQTGVFISRSSVNLIQLKRTWIMAILQALNFVLCLTQVIYRYIPNIWIMFFIILYEGCLGGLSYVNTFYRILQETTPAYREYAMASATISDSIGITFAGFLAIPLRNWLCQLAK
ncbi:G1/S-specific cyclin cln3 [Clonorchis sinensis]|uniref:Battenin n=1 Tax=Clonorchis sinensis TaxID=79923 RepID=A0A8T1MLI6_CLOSI|nr:G1/S-specific cyclin cln3 [Clonorchis sinensis]